MLNMHIPFYLCANVAPPCSGNPMPRRRGSALVLTLLVVSMLVIMVLAFSAFVRLELRSVVARQSLLRAQSNARLASELAVGRLQELLGPDQRVSATADLFTAGSGNIYQPSLQRSATRRNWVGVWDASGYNERDAAAKPFLGWLVSSPSETEITTLNTVAAVAPSDVVTLVGPGSVLSANDAVSARKLTHADASGGQNGYAWWVGDEGVKARFNLQDPYRNSSDTTTRQYSMKASQRHAAELFTYDNVRRLADDNLYPLDNAAFTATREKMAGKEQLALLAGGTGPAAAAYRQLRLNRFHDITLLSRGLLADVRNGGLKQDLSLAFEMPLSEFNASRFAEQGLGAEVPVYRPPGYPSNEKIAYLFHVTDFSPYGFQPENSPNSAAQNPAKTIAPVLRGPNWHFLRNYARIYKQNDPDRSAYGLPALSYTESGGTRRYFGRSLYPKTEGLISLRRYGQDATVWTHAESYGPVGSNYTISQPIGRPIFPAIAPLVTRVQTVLSLRSRPELATAPAGNQVLDLYIDPVITLWNPYNVRLATGRSNGHPFNSVCVI